MPKSEQERLDVQILDRSYQLSCAPEDRPLLMECVALVDSRMRAVKATGKLQGADRIAVMAALTVAKDFLTANLSNGQGTLATEKEEMLQAIGQINQKLDLALMPQEKLF